MADVSDELDLGDDADLELCGYLGAVGSPDEDDGDATADIEAQMPQSPILPDFERFLAGHDLSYRDRETIVTKVVRALEDNDGSEQDDQICYTTALAAVTKLAVDDDATIRTRLAEAVADLFAQNVASCWPAQHALFAIAFRMLRDDHEPARKAYRKLIVSSVRDGGHHQLFEHTFTNSHLSEFSNPSPGDTSLEIFVLETLMILAEIGMLLDAQFCENDVAPSLNSLISSQNFRIRKGCVTAVSAVASNLGQGTSISNQIVSNFFELSSDEIWGVRKACAECLHSISKIIDNEERAKLITKCFSKLAGDESRWVRCAAFKNLGAVIATFVDEPPCYDDLVLQRIQSIEQEPPNDIKSTVSSSNSTEAKGQQELAEDLGELPVVVPRESIKETQARRRTSPAPWDIPKLQAFLKDDLPCSSEETKDSNSGNSTNREHETDDTDDRFNSFSYWRPVLPEVDLGNLLSDLLSEEPLSAFSPSSAGSATATAVHSNSAPVATSTILNDAAASAELPTEDPSDASPVPAELIDHFKKMALPCSTKSIDSDIHRTCAFSLPAVVWSLGRSHWHCIRETYLALADDLDWKVRACIAQSTHVCALILGRNITEKDLLHTFTGFLKDFEVIRDGVISHFTDFIRVLSPMKRGEFLPYLIDLSQISDSHNWRRRSVVIEQLNQIIEMLPLDKVVGDIQPIALALAVDRVTSVRHSAYEMIANLIYAVEQSDDAALGVREELKAMLSRSARSIHRQGFAHICRHLCRQSSPDIFCKVALEDLITLADDTVPNVRIVVAKTIRSVVASDYLAGHLSLRNLTGALHQLQNDQDPDVVYFAGGKPLQLNPIQPVTEDELAHIDNNTVVNSCSESEA